jgi:predicted O-methyltransferase YrrM
MGADARATAMLLNALVAAGALEKSGDEFRLTPASRRLAGGGRDGLMHMVNLWSTWSTLTEAVKAGTSVRIPGVEAAHDAWTRNFIAAMHGRAANDAETLVRLVDTSGERRMLDIGGGSGAYSIALATANPELRAEVLDLPQVVALAEDYIRQAGLQQRIATKAGDLRSDDFGSGYDLLLLSAINHMLGADENRDLIRRCARALRPGGRLVIREFILNEDRTSPKPAALFALNMLVGTRNGATYTQSEYIRWMTDAGFRAVSRPDPAGDILIGTL